MSVFNELTWLKSRVVSDLNEADACWQSATRAERLLAAIEARLIAAGAVIELRQFYGLSAQEVDVMLRLEREGNHDPVCCDDVDSVCALSVMHEGLVA